MIVSVDMESYSEAGYVWDEHGGKWRPIAAGREGGLPAVGSDVYCRHQSTEVLILGYQFPGEPVQTWVPNVMPDPKRLFEHVRGGGLISAYNSMFEYLLWKYVLTRKLDWPELKLENTRDTLAVGRLFGLPGKLKTAALALGLAQQKTDLGAVDDDSNLIRWFSCPKRPTKNSPRKRRFLGEFPKKARMYYAYCAQDVRVEKAIADACPPQSDYELAVWKMDQRINERGVAVDVPAVNDLIAVVEAVTVKQTEELVRLTNGAVPTVASLDAMRDFLATHRIHIPDLKAETIRDVMADEGHEVHKHPWAVRVLRIRQELASASVKKLYAIRNRLCDDGRLRGLFSYCGAERTGRWIGRGVQVQNLPRGNAKVYQCPECDAWSGHEQCYCGALMAKKKWCHAAALAALDSFRCMATTGTVEENYATAVSIWGDNVLDVVIGCLRAVLIAGPGKRFISSDYSAIEAVVVAALAGEEWRMEVFRTHGKIYELSASKITGIPFDEYARYKAENGENHPTRNTIGKVAELASAYGGGLGAWKKFGAGAFMTDDEIKVNVKKWRAASPNIVNFWYDLDRAAIRAIDNPGMSCPVGMITYHYDGSVLRCYLPSGRALVYQAARVVAGETPWGSPKREIVFMAYGDGQWRQDRTYGGKLCENITQAVARDLMAHGMLQTEARGLHIVMHIHDEEVCEEDIGVSSVAEVEEAMGDLPPWAKGWPVKATGGWEGREFRKD